jgi:hypothetical protein
VVGTLQGYHKHSEKSNFTFLKVAAGTSIFTTSGKGTPPHQSRQFLGFSRFHFLQRPLCKVDPELCTEKRIPTATAQGYAPETVDKFWIWGVDNWGRLGNRGEKVREGWMVPFPGTCTTIANLNHYAQPIAFTNNPSLKHPPISPSPMPHQRP